MNCVLATENEKLREEVKKWVQQAVNTQRDLDEAKRKRLELEKENDSLNTEAIQVRKKNKRLLRNIADLHEEMEAKKTAIEIEVLQHSIKEYKSQFIEAKSKNRFLQKVVNSSESQLLICRKAREVVTDDYAQLIEKYQEMLIDFMMWKDEYETLRRKYDDAIELLTTGRGKSVVGTSSQVEVDLNQVLEDMHAYPSGFTPQRSSSPRMVDRTYPTSFPTSNPNTTTQQAAHVSNPISTPITKCDVVIPPKFKTPDFEKYNGTTCSKSHLVMYCWKMSAYAHDDKLLIHCFQDSLVGSASRWYMQLDGSQVHTWKDLADSFFKKYKYNIDMAPDRLDLRRMEKKNVETFKEYAQRWRELVAKMQPPLTDKELTAMFINTLRAPYYDRMVGSASTNFLDVITIGERIQFGVKNGRIVDPASETRRMMTPKKKGEVHELSSTQRVSTHVSSPIVGQTNFSPGYQNGGQSPFGQSTQRNIRNNWKQTPFDPIPMSSTELLPQLLKSHQVAIVPQKPLQPPYPKWYDPNAKCEYHVGAVGHSTENCFPLKTKVQSLVKVGWLKFKKTGEGPNVNQNPLPNHKDPTINVVDTFTQ
ncbi:uncharacterized protein E5676_scaffold106G001510 [Cucumis melo var. makuwa]|uniref:Retrotransposon gag domain-containing protein n=1 Tax=Cucumis melo var. makuwa TaxID=1194695 RepID=A0A5D3CLA9_CUCMM|nr:uncharacterized protein E5676_scaffold106G001510 [Cucumis melo var. makuwa]